MFLTELYTATSPLLTPYPMNRIFYCLVFLCVSPLFAQEQKPYVISEQCLETISIDDTDNIFAQCLWSNTHSLATAIQNGRIRHSFGSYDLLTDEAKLIRARAQEGKGFYQYFWGALVLLELYPANVVDDEKKQKIKAEGLDWVKRAADAGYPDAQIYMAEDYLEKFQTLNSEEAKTQAMVYAESLIQNKHPEGRYLAEKVRKTPTLADVEAMFKARLGIYQYLSRDELKYLAYALSKGEYVDTRVTGITLDFEPEIDKAIALLYHLVDEHVDVDSAYYLAELLSESDAAEALYYFRWSADRGVAPAMLWLARYYICADNRAKGMLYLNRALNEGDPDAESFAEQVSLTGHPEFCS